MSDGLFSTWKVRGIELRNRIAVSPMCQYSSNDGMADDWHLVHLGSRAAGGAGLVMVEATAVEPQGRISAADMGLWKDAQIEPLARIARFVRDLGAAPAIQIAHAGRKASTAVPWDGGKPVSPGEGGWQTVAPSALPFAPGYPVPLELQISEIEQIVAAFADCAVRARNAGFEVLEIHGAHGYLFNQFMSPLSNTRKDGYGGSFSNRTRFAREVVHAVRAVWPERLPLFLRISASDWEEGGWTADDSVEFARMVAPMGVDLMDCSSGGISHSATIPVGPGYQVQFAERIRREASVATGAVGLITDPRQADSIIRNGQADIVLLAREFLRDPYWPHHAAMALGLEPAPPRQYLRAFVNPGGRGSR